MKERTKELLKTTVDLSSIVYKKKEEVRSWCNDKYTDFKWIECPETDTQLFLCCDEENTYLTTRGSDSDRDWETNFDLGFKGIFHEGFAKAAFSVWMDVSGAFLHKKYKSKNVVINGHSLAGALSTVFTYSLNPIVPVGHLITYGSPRVVSKEAIDPPGVKILRVVNNNDGVCLVPPRFMGFKHKGELIYLTEDGDWVEGISRFRKFVDHIEGLIEDVGESGLDTVKDHNILDYQRLVYKNF